MASSGRGRWVVVFAAAVGLFFSFGSIAVYSFTVFLKHLTETFGWGRGEVSFAFTAACIAGLGGVLVVGRLVDRIGGRAVALAATTLFGLAFAALSLISAPWHLYAIFLCLGIAGSGTSSIPYSSVVSHWFDRNRGLALGLTMGGLGLGAAVAPSLAQALIDRIGWRSAYVTLGAAVLLVACPAILALLREPARPGNDENMAPRASLAGTSAREALGSSILWTLLVALFLASAAVQGCLIHLVPLLTDGGLSAERAAFAASLFGFANLVGRLGTGYFLDRVFAPYVVVTAFCLAAVGMALLIGGAEWALPAALLMGIGFGAETDAVPYLVGRYFGLRAFGEIYGYAFVTVPLGGAIGPLLVGIGYDRTHSYTVALVCACAALAIAALLTTRLGAYPTWTTEAAGAPLAPAMLEPAFEGKHD